jgi:glycerophosphoryl diester phosphodiesterase
MEPHPAVRRIAHAHGNRRAWIERALSAGVDFIEADLRWDGRTIRVRHEHRLPLIPLLWNHRLRGFHRQGPFAIGLGPLWLRLDVQRLSFSELLARVGGRAGLMLDLKRDRHTREEAGRFVRAVFAGLEMAGFPGPIDFCGAGDLLDAVLAERPGQLVHYSIDNDAALGWLPALAARGATGVSIHRALLTPERGRWLREQGFDVIAWDVGTLAEADAAIACGASAIIADDLALLRALAVGPGEGATR